MLIPNFYVDYGEVERRIYRAYIRRNSINKLYAHLYGGTFRIPRKETTLRIQEHDIITFEPIEVTCVTNSTSYEEAASGPLYVTAIRDTGVVCLVDVADSSCVFVTTLADLKIIKILRAESPAHVHVQVYPEKLPEYIRSGKDMTVYKVIRKTGSGYRCASVASGKECTVSKELAVEHEQVATACGIENDYWTIPKVEG